MASIVSITYVTIGSAANGSGIFSGQNMQCDWDSNAPSQSSIGTVMGRYSVTSAEFAILQNVFHEGQALNDSNYSLNHTQLSTL